MTWFEVGLKLGLGLIAAVALVGLVIVVVAAVCISCVEHEQREVHRRQSTRWRSGRGRS